MEIRCFYVSLDMDFWIMGNMNEVDLYFRLIKLFVDWGV